MVFSFIEGPSFIIRILIDCILKGNKNVSIVPGYNRNMPNPMIICRDAFFKKLM